MDQRFANVGFEASGMLDVIRFRSAADVFSEADIQD
jgi:hypothetical protein